MFLAAIAYLSLLAGGDKAPSREMRDKIVEQIGVVLRDQAFVPGVDFSDWKDVVQEYREDIAEAKSSLDFIQAVNGALFKYGVSHLAFTPPGMGLGDKIKSFGFSVEPLGKAWVVTRVFAKTEEEKAGIQRGMVLEECPSPETWEKRRKITVKFRDETKTLHSVDLHKEKVGMVIPSAFTPLESDANVLGIQDLLTGYDKKIIDGFMAEAAKRPYLIVDLRSDFGGAPESVSHLMGYFVAPGTLYGAAITKEIYPTGPGPKTDDERASLVQKVKAPYALTADKSPARYGGHIAVLIDRESGSAAEVLALALRECAGAKVFGTPSSGLVLFMNGTDLAGGYHLYFPWRDYWSVKGYRIESNRVVPDFEASDAEAGPLLEPLRLRALKYLRETYSKS